jgi:polysaccharide biosynthesis transport protein
MGIIRLIRVMLARWAVVLSVFIIAAAAGFAVAYYAPVTYSATAVVMVESRADPVVGGMQIMTPNFLVTQADVIKSTRVSNKVIRNLKLGENPALREQFKDSQAQGTYDEWLSRLLQKNLLTEPGRGSNVIRVTYASSDARFSALMANAFVTAYLDAVQEMRLEPAKRYSSFFEDRSKDLRENVEKAQAKLSAFQREKGVIATDERQDIEIAKLNELQAQVLQVQAQAIEATSRQTQNQASADRTQEVLNSGIVTSIKSEIIRQDTKLIELTSRLGERHPQVIDTRSALADLRNKLDTEVGRVGGSVAVSTKITKQRENELKSALELQRAKVLRMKQTRDEIAVMQRDVEATQRAYDGVQLRFNQSSLESQNPQSSMSILNLAEIPNETKTQIFMKNAIKALLAALGLGLLAGFIRELFDKRIRSVEDIQTAINLPVLGILPGPDKKVWFRTKRSATRQLRVLRLLPLTTGRP